MLKQQYRSELGVVFDILRVIVDYGRNGTIISAITRSVNLSHYTAIEKCQKLSDFGLINSTCDKGSRIFTITEKGICFFNEMQKFIEIAQAVKIRY